MSNITFTKSSGIYQLKAEQYLPISKDDAWSFLVNPKNLSIITPPHMNFKITSPYTNDKIYAGQIITYKVSPFKGFRSNWVTEITEVVEGKYFIDEQRFGPYAMWHHEHMIEEKNNGTNMIDIISYKPPFGFIGALAEPVIIRKQLKQIFEFREKKLNELFPA